MNIVMLDLIWAAVLLLCQAAAGYFLFERCGEKGWKSFIPVYSRYICHRIVWKTAPFAAYVVCGLCLPVTIFFIPAEAGGWQMSMALLVSMLLLRGMFCYRLAKYFGRGLVYTTGLFVMGPVFYIFLAAYPKKGAGDKNVPHASEQGKKGAVWKLFKVGSIPLTILLTVGIVGNTLLYLGIGAVRIDSRNFPGSEFREQLLEEEYGRDGLLTRAERESVKELHIYWEGPEGLKYFPELTSLTCSDLPAEVSTVDIGDNPKLREFDCEDASLTYLDVSKNQDLELLHCMENDIRNLDVSGNPHLKELWCDTNSVTSLDVTRNPELIHLWCDRNALTDLDVRKNQELTSLTCSWNEIDSLELSENPKLKELMCTGNRLTQLDVSGNPELARLICGENDITELKLGRAESLKELDCSYNQLSSLDVSGRKQLEVLDVRGNCDLKELDCRGAALGSLDLDGCPNITALYAGEQNITVEVSYDPESGTYRSDSEILSPAAEIRGNGIELDAEGRLILEKIDGQTAEFSVTVYDSSRLESGSGVLSGTITFVEME